MTQFTINIPDDINIDKADIKKYLAARLYQQGKLSLGQAARLAELSKNEFAEELIDYNVSIINHSPDDIMNDAAKF